MYTYTYTAYMYTYAYKYVAVVGRDSSVGIVTRYWLDGPWIESRWACFSAPVQTGLESYPAFYKMCAGSSQG